MYFEWLDPLGFENFSFYRRVYLLERPSTISSKTSDYLVPQRHGCYFDLHELYAFRLYICSQFTCVILHLLPCHPWFTLNVRNTCCFMKWPSFNTYALKGDKPIAIFLPKAPCWSAYHAPAGNSSQLTLRRTHIDIITLAYRLFVT